MTSPPHSLDQPPTRASASRGAGLLPRPGLLRTSIDIAVVLWVLLWIFVGVSIGNDVSRLGSIANNAAQVGRAVSDTGQTLSTLQAIPLVGAQIGQAAQQIQSAGQQTIVSAQASRSGVTQLSWLLALAIAVIPSIPILALYLPLRILGAGNGRRG